MIKYGKYAFTKGMFPWMANWFYNFVGSNKIGKGTTIEEEIVGDKYIDIGDNCYIGVNSALSSHVVEGIFGRIPYFEIKIRDNVTCAGFNIVGPGCDMGDNSYLLPMAATNKYNTTKGSHYYFGLPLRKIFTKKIMNYLKLSPEDLERDKELRMKQQEKKNKKKSREK
jgi:serine acetyltransferase